MILLIVQQITVYYTLTVLHQSANKLTNRPSHHVDAGTSRPKTSNVYDLQLRHSSRAVNVNVVVSRAQAKASMPASYIQNHITISNIYF